MMRKIGFEEELFCFVCKSDSEGEPMVLINKNAEYTFWVHREACLEKYKRFLYNPSEQEAGAILGICIYCGTPVRGQHLYYVGKEDFSDEELKMKGQNRLKYSFTEFPQKQPIFSHATCGEGSCIEEFCSF